MRLGIVITWVLLFSAPSVCRAQESHTQYSLKYYVALYTLGKNWHPGKPAGEQDFFKEHSAYLAELRKNRRITVGARYADTGMVVFRAGTEEEVRGWLEGDPGIQNKLFKVEIFELSPFYRGCLE